MQSKKGFGIILVLIVVAVLSILGASLLFISESEAKQIAYEDKRMQAYYLAKSGVDSVSKYILKNPTDADKIKNDNPSDENSQLTNGKFTIDVNDGSTTDEIKVIGTGIVSGVQNTSTVIMHKMSLDEILDKAIYTNSPLDITGMKVDGDIQSGGAIQYKSTGSNSFSDTAYPNSSRSIDFISPFPTPGVSVLDVHNGETRDINGSANYDQITIEQHGILNINANSSDISIVVRNLSIDNELRINATSGHSVSIYVTGEMDVTTKGLINNTASKNLFIYLAPTSKFIIQANMILNGYIIGPQATVEFQSNGSTVNGAVYANVVEKNDAGSSPNGAINYVALPAGTGVGGITTEYEVLRWEK